MLIKVSYELRYEFDQGQIPKHGHAIKSNFGHNGN